MLTINMAKYRIKKGLSLGHNPKIEYETKELEVLAKLYTSLYDELVRVQSMLLNLESKDANDRVDI